MMISSPFTAIYYSPNRSPRQNVGRLGVVLHGAVTSNLDSLRRLTMGAKQVSATSITKDEAREAIVPSDDDRPWSLSDSYWDSALRSSECCNEPDLWNFSDASLWSLAYQVAWWAQQDGFYPHRSGHPTTWTVLGHKEVYTIHKGSYATACPQGMDLNLVTTRAQQLLAAGPVPDPVETPWEEYERESEMLSMIFALDPGAKPDKRWAIVGPGYWRVITTQDAANAASQRFGAAGTVSWNDWDNAFDAAVSSGFVPTEGQTSRTV